MRTLHTAGSMVKLLTQPIKACLDALYASNSGLYVVCSVNIPFHHARMINLLNMETCH